MGPDTVVNASFAHVMSAFVLNSADLSLTLNPERTSNAAIPTYRQSTNQSMGTIEDLDRKIEQEPVETI